VQKNNSKSLEQNDKLDCRNIVSSQRSKVIYMFDGSSIYSL